MYHIVMDDSILLIRDHMIDVCMDLVSTEDEEEHDMVKEDFTEMVDILLEATDLTVVDVASNGDSHVFNCTIQLVTDLD